MMSPWLWQQQHALGSIYTLLQIILSNVAIFQQMIRLTAQIPYKLFCVMRQHQQFLA